GALIVPTDLNVLFNAARTAGAKIHTNSWGSTSEPPSGYDLEAQDVDENTWNNKDFSILFAAGNEGIDSDGDGVINHYSIGTPASAKNCIAVGASENSRPGQQYEYPQGTDNPATWGWFDDLSYAINPIFSDGMSDNSAGLAPFSSRGPVL